MDRPDHLALAFSHVENGRVLVERQRALVVRLKAARTDSTLSEALLTQLEISLGIFERDLADMETRYHRTASPPP